MSLKIKLSGWQEIPLKEYLYFSFGMAALLATVLILLKNILPPVIPFFYGSPVGESQLANSLSVLLAPFLCFLITMVNVLVASGTEDKFLKRVLIGGAFFFSFLLTITIFKIIFLVGFF